MSANDPIREQLRAARSSRGTSTLGGTTPGAADEQGQAGEPDDERLTVGERINADLRSRRRR
ncbi:hypothetical protein [Cellulomonas sp. P5_C5]